MVEDRLKVLVGGTAEQSRAGCAVLQKISRTTEVFAPKIPIVSRELAYATTPHREINPYDGLKPTVPVYAAGNLTEPPVSVPIALRKTISAAIRQFQGM